VARKAAGNKNLPKKVFAALNDRPSATDSGALLASLMKKWGGPEQLASDMYEEFQQAPTGGMVRKHILELIQRLVIQNTNNEVGLVKKPPEMEDSECEDLVMYYLGRLTGATDPARS
jgi:hypothetical protein